MSDKNTIILFYPLVDKYSMIPNLPFSIMNLERMVRDLPVRTILIDERIQPDYFSEIEKHKDSILFVGVSAMCGYQMISGRSFSKNVREITDAKIVWGGWFSSVSPELAINEPFIDYIICGQGEIPFRKVTEALLYNTELKTIEGLGFKTDKGIHINEPPPVVNDKTFPEINFEAIDINKIIEINGCTDLHSRSLNYISNSGCPYNCTFCCLPSVWGQKSFSKDLDIVTNDLKKLNTEYEVFKIGFNDDNFFSKHSFVMSLCQNLIKNKTNFEWEANAHIEYFLNNYSVEDINTLYDAGCRSIKFGVESGDQTVLDKINKKTSIGSCLKVAELLSHFKIKCVFYIMIAFPWNPDKDFKLTLNFLSRAKLINPRLETGINFFIPLPKTPLYEEAINYGFPPFTSFDNMVEFISTPFVAPWWRKNYRNELHDFLWFYFKYANPHHYKIKNVKIRKLDFIVNKFFYPVCWLRLKTKCRKFRLDARLYFLGKRIFDKITNNKFADNAEVIGRCKSWNR